MEKGWRKDGERMEKGWGRNVKEYKGMEKGRGRDGERYERAREAREGKRGHEIGEVSGQNVAGKRIERDLYSRSQARRYTGISSLSFMCPLAGRTSRYTS